MKEIYTGKWTEIVTQAHDRYVWSDPIQNGKVLHVQNMYGHGHEREAKDRIKRGGRKMARLRYLSGRASGPIRARDFPPSMTFTSENMISYSLTFPTQMTRTPLSCMLSGVLMDRDDFRLM